jgi:hypothetical protein
MSSPIFVVGTMRSGSTLLRLLLDSHPNIAIGEETGFGGGLSAARTIPGWRYGAEWSSRIGWSREELDARLRDLYSGMFERSALSQGKKRWGDKTPFHSWHMTDLAEVFPEAVFVAITRHPAAVVTSLKKKFHYAVPEASDYWTSTNLEVLRQGVDLGPDRFAALRYEDVVTTTEPTLRDLVGWLGEPWSDDVLRHQEVQAATGAPRLVDGSTSTREPIDPHKATAWQQALTPAEVSTVVERTGEVARFLGYEPADADRLVPWGTDAHVLTGGALRARHAAWSPHLELAPASRADTGMEMTPQEMARRVERAEAALARIRSRPVVRASEAVRRVQKRLPLPSAGELRSGLRRARTRNRGSAAPSPDER